MSTGEHRCKQDSASPEIFQKRPQSTKLKSAAALSSSTVPELCFHQDHFCFRPLLSPETLRNPSSGRLQSISSKPLNRSEEHTSELQSRGHLVCRLLLEKKKTLLHKTHYVTIIMK